MKNETTQKEIQTDQEGSAKFAIMLVAVIGIAIILLIAKMVGIF